VETLFKKIRDEFRKTIEKDRKVEQLNKERGHMMNMSKNSQKLPGGVVIRNDLSLRSLKED